MDGPHTGPLGPTDPSHHRSAWLPGGRPAAARGGPWPYVSPRGCRVAASGGSQRSGRIVVEVLRSSLRGATRARWGHGIRRHLGPLVGRRSCRSGPFGPTQAHLDAFACVSSASAAGWTTGRRRIEQLRPLAAFLPLAGEPACLRSVFRADPQRWLPEAGPLGEGRWSAVVPGPGWPERVALRIGIPWASSNTLWRSLSWEPLPGEDPDGEWTRRHLAIFDGELGLFVSGDGASLAIDGRYRAPAAIVGAPTDEVALRRTVRGTADRLMVDVAAKLREPLGTRCLERATA